MQKYNDRENYIKLYKISEINYTLKYSEDETRTLFSWKFYKLLVENLDTNLQKSYFLIKYNSTRLKL